MYSLLRPLLFRLDAERAHTVSLAGARVVQATALNAVRSMYAFDDTRLTQTLWGHTFPNPVGLAAGADKNATLVPFWEAVGFGFVEVGSVSAQSCAGNPTPRAFRLPDDEAIINRMGLNNDGAATIADRIASRADDRSRPLGVNLAKTHDPDIMGDAAVDDFRASFRALASHASYVVLNISCPNTDDGKTFEAPDALDALLQGIRAEQNEGHGSDVPVLLKLSPPTSDQVVYDTQVEDVLTVAQMHDVDGIVATNTASDRKALHTSDARLESIGAGGLSGKPLAARATRLVRYVYRATNGGLPIIGVGGVHDADTAYAKIRAGASLVQLYTALVYEGPGLVQRINEGLVDRLRRDGYDTISDAVGADA